MEEDQRTTKTLITRRKEQLCHYKKKLRSKQIGAKHRVNRISRLKQKAIGNQDKVISLKHQVEALKKTVTQTTDDNKVLKR